MSNSYNDFSEDYKLLDRLREMLRVKLDKDEIRIELLKALGEAIPERIEHEQSK